MKDKILGNFKGFAQFMAGCTFIGEGVMLALAGVNLAFRGCAIADKADAKYEEKKVAQNDYATEFTARSEYNQDV